MSVKVLLVLVVCFIQKSPFYRVFNSLQYFYYNISPPYTPSSIFLFFFYSCVILFLFPSTHIIFNNIVVLNAAFICSSIAFISNRQVVFLFLWFQNVFANVLLVHSFLFICDFLKNKVLHFSYLLLYWRWLNMC